MDAVIYLRVSTKEQAAKDESAEGYSIPAQREACLRHIAERGWNLAGEFVDAGESARTADRPMLKALLRRVAEGGVGAVVVHKIDGWPARWRTTWRSGRPCGVPASSLYR
jgi:DNA invertase Pin-like site-specific DNA recombinase